jgi:hypothetical protein
MSTSKQESPNANQLWAGEIKVTVHVPKELTPNEERQLAKSLEDLSEKFKTIAEDALAHGWRIDVQVS